MSAVDSSFSFRFCGAEDAPPVYSLDDWEQAREIEAHALSAWAAWEKRKREKVVRERRRATAAVVVAPAPAPAE